MAQLVKNVPAMQETPAVQETPAFPASVISTWVGKIHPPPRDRLPTPVLLGLGNQGVAILLQFWRPGLDPWAGKIPWRREQLPNPVFWPREFHKLYSPWRSQRVGHFYFSSLQGTWLPSTAWIGNSTEFHGLNSFWEWVYIKSFYSNAAFKTLFWFWILV